MNIRHIFSGEIIQNQKVARRIPVFLCVFVLIFSYISIGYHMQKLKQRQIKLENQYTELQGIAVSVQGEKVKVTRKENIQRLIKQYHINIITTPAIPIIIERTPSKE